MLQLPTWSSQAEVSILKRLETLVFGISGDCCRSPFAKLGAEALKLEIESVLKVKNQFGNSPRENETLLGQGVMDT